MNTSVGSIIPSSDSSELVFDMPKKGPDMNLISTMMIIKVHLYRFFRDASVETVAH